MTDCEVINGSKSLAYLVKPSLLTKPKGTEEYQHVKTNPKYLISNYGNVMNTKSNKYLLGTINKWRYVVLQNKKYSVSYLVATHFLGEHDNSYKVIHKDGNNINDHIDNLEWVQKLPYENTLGKNY